MNTEVRETEMMELFRELGETTQKQFLRMARTSVSVGKYCAEVEAGLIHPSSAE